MNETVPDESYNVIAINTPLQMMSYVTHGTVTQG